MLSDHTSLFLSCPAVRDADHPVVAVVSDPVWEEDGGLRRHARKQKNDFVFGINLKRTCVYGISLSTVGSTLHAPHRLHQEPPDHFLHGVRGCRRERGGSFPPALVSSCSPGSDAGLLYPEFISKCCLCAFRSMLPDVVDDFKVRNPHIHGHEAIFFSFYVFFIKFSSGVSLGISTLSLK